MQWATDNSPAGSVQVEWFIPTLGTVQADLWRARMWGRVFRAWRANFDAETARVAAIPKRTPGRPAEVKKLKTLQKLLGDLRESVNKRCDEREAPNPPPAAKPSAQDWLDARYARLPETYLLADRLTLRHAGLCCGYGAYRPISRTAARNPDLLWDDKDFIHSLACDIDAALSHIDWATSRVKPSLALFDGTKKGDISFTLGGIFCYLAAEQWMDHLNTRLEGMYHYLLFGASMVASNKNYCLPAKKEFPAEGSSPDYLAHDSKDCLHTFEAKGGQASNRHARVQEGLLQLQAATQSVTLQRRHGTAARPVRTGVAVATALDPGQKIRVLAYDPPGGGSEETEFLPVLPEEAVFPDAPQHPSWTFMPDVAFCLDAFEKYQLFRSLPGDEFVTADHRWKQSGPMLFGVNKRIPYEALGEKLKGYRTIRAGLPQGLVDRSVQELPRRTVDWKDRLLKKADFSSDRLGRDLRRSLEIAVREAEHPSEVIVKLALDVMNLDIDARFISDNTALVVPDLARQDSGYRFKAGPSGLFVAELN